MKKTASLSDTQKIDQFDLYSITGDQIRLVVPDVYQENYLSPDGTMIASHDPIGDQLRIINLSAQLGMPKITYYNVPDQLGWGILEVYWSPDSARFAVTTECHLYVVTLATGNFTDVVRNCYNIRSILNGPQNVAWSPNGTQLAFDVIIPEGFPIGNSQEDLHGGRPTNLIVASADGSVQRVLDEHGSHPVWSPDGQQILYTSGYRREDSDVDVYCNERLYASHADGSGKVLLAETTGRAEDSYIHPYYDHMGWSSDGGHVFFIQGQPHEPGQLNVIRPDGTDKVTLGGNQTAYVMYLPQSNRIMWLEFLDPDGRARAIFVSGLDGTNKITWDEGEDLWAYPCGNRVLWKKNDSILTANLDGSGKSTFPAFNTIGGDFIYSPDCSQATLFEYSGADQIPIIDLMTGNVQYVEAQGTEMYYIVGWVSTRK